MSAQNSDAKEKLILSYYNHKKVAILGYREEYGGPQRAKFLRENGIEVIVGLRKGDEFWEKAEKDGFKVYLFWEAAEQADVAQVW